VGLLSGVAEEAARIADRVVKPFVMGSGDKWTVVLSAGKLLQGFKKCYRYTEVVSRDTVVVLFVCKRGDN